MALRSMKANSRRDHLLVVLVVTLAIATLFGRVLFCGEMLLFRDAAHFYYPSLQHAQQAWAESLANWSVPLWNADEEVGRPLAADPTAALFYPPKLLFALPIDFASSYVIYVVGHVFFAAFSMFVACRWLRCSVMAAGIAASSYAFGGTIVFQYCNVIFLVGAAWLPIGMALGWLAITNGDWRSGVGMSVVQAMMVLGGDPQIAYYLSLLMLIAVVVSIRNQAKSPHSEPVSRPSVSIRTKLAITIAAPMLAGCLAAIQVIPSWHWAGDSERSVDRGAASPFEKPIAGSHRKKSYDFSIPPWRWVELVLPNFGGRLFPQHHRWLTVLPANARTWTPSLYMGLLPIVLAARRVLQGKGALDRWLRLIVAFAVAGSLGWYGVGWLLNEVSVSFGGEARLWGPVGGLYWGLNHLLPLHSQFRYPAKMWTLAACAIAILSAQEITEKPHLFSASAVRRFVWRGPILLLVVFAATASTLWHFGPLEAATSSRLFGPLVQRGAITDVVVSFAQVLVVSSAMLVVLRFMRKQHSRLVALLLMTAAELVVAHGHSIVSASRSAWEDEPSLVTAIKKHAKEQGNAVFRVHRVTKRGTYPSTWRTEGSATRQLDGLQWDRTTCAHRFGLSHGIAMLRPSASFSSGAFETFMDDSNGPVSPERLASANVRYIVGRTEDVAQYPGYRVFAADQLFGETICAAYRASGIAGAWVLDQDDRRIDGLVQIREYTPSRVRLDAKLEQPGTLVLADAYHAGWQCRIQNVASGEVTLGVIRQVNGLFRGVDLEAGEHVLTFAYRPVEFRVGATVSMLAWGGMLMFAMAKLLRLSLRGQLVT